MFLRVGVPGSSAGTLQPTPTQILFGCDCRYLDKAAPIPTLVQVVAEHVQRPMRTSEHDGYDQAHHIRHTLRWDMLSFDGHVVTL